MVSPAGGSGRVGAQSDPTFNTNRPTGTFPTRSICHSLPSLPIKSLHTSPGGPRCLTWMTPMSELSSKTAIQLIMTLISNALTSTTFAPYNQLLLD